MLLCEISSSDSQVDWFVEMMSSIFNTAFNRAESNYEKSGDARVAKMQATTVLGKWYSENVINKRGNSLQALLASLQPHHVKLPDLIGTGSDKAKQGYSSSKSLLTIIHQIASVFKSKGYV